MGIDGLIRELAVNAVNSGKPVVFEYGTVRSVSPLKIFVDAKKILPENVLVLTNAVKDHYVDVRVNFITGMIYEKEGLLADHNHDVTGVKKVLVKNGLAEGESVLLARMDGGQRYIVIDRISEPTASGEWGESEDEEE